MDAYELPPYLDSPIYWVEVKTEDDPGTRWQPAILVQCETPEQVRDVVAHHRNDPETISISVYSRKGHGPTFQPFSTYLRAPIDVISEDGDFLLEERAWAKFMATGERQ